MAKPPSLFSFRLLRLVRLVLSEYRDMKKAKKARLSSGHMNSSERSAEFQRLRKSPSRGRPPSVTVVRGTPDRKKR